MPQTTLSTTATPNAVTGNPKRTGLTITNIDGTNIAYLQANQVNPNKITTATASIAIGPNQSRTYVVAWQGAQSTQDSYQGISAAGNPVIIWEEHFD